MQLLDPAISSPSLLYHPHSSLLPLFQLSRSVASRQNLTYQSRRHKPNNQECLHIAQAHAPRGGENGEFRFGPDVGPAPQARGKRPRFASQLAAVVAVLGLPWGLDRSADASPPCPARSNPLEASTSEAARQDAIRSIPLDKLAAEDRAKVESVLSTVSIFRRMPVKVVDCDPDLYLFLVRHPDVVVNIWELMKLSRLQLRQIDENQFQITEPAGTVAKFGFVYRSHDTHVLYGEGKYEGPLMTRPVKGRGVLVLKCGYVRETNGRYYITSRLDCFLTIEPAGAELIGKTVSPLMGKTADNNFVQTVAFVGSLSRTAEVNSRGVQRLAGQLTHVQPEVRSQFADVAGQRGRRSRPLATASTQADGTPR